MKMYPPILPPPTCAPELVYFDTYGQARTFSSRIVARTQDGTMPPGSLPAKEISVLAAWAEGGNARRV